MSQYEVSLPFNIHTNRASFWLSDTVERGEHAYASAKTRVTRGDEEKDDLSLLELSTIVCSKDIFPGIYYVIYLTEPI